MTSSYRTKSEQERLKTNKIATDNIRNSINTWLGFNFGALVSEDALRAMLGDNYQYYPVANVSYHNSGYALDVNWQAVPQNIRSIIKNGFENTGFIHGDAWNDPVHFEQSQGWDTKRKLIEANKAEATIIRDGGIYEYDSLNIPDQWWFPSKILIRR